MAEEEVQQPEKPAKKKKSSGGLSLPMMIVIGAGTLIVLVGVSLFAINYMVNNIIDKKLGSVSDTTKTHSHEDEANKKLKEHKKELDKTFKELEEEEYFETEEGVSYMETDRIVTNPKFSTRFAVIRLGLSYREKVAEGEGEAEGGHEEAKEGEVDHKAQKYQAQIKSIINDMIGTMTEEEIQQQRQNLPIIIKEKLTPVFKKQKKYLRDVLIVEFIIQ